MRKSILKAAFRLFSERGIEAVTMPEVGEACGISRASVFRYFPSKLDLVVAVSVWSWQEYDRTADPLLPVLPPEGCSAAELLELFLEHFLNLYRNHRSILRYNQFFNLYIMGEQHQEERLQPYLEVIHGTKERFHAIYARSQQDGSLRTDLPEAFMYSAVVHIMQGAVTRYAVGPTFERDEGSDPEGELRLLKETLLRSFRSQAEG